MIKIRDCLMSINRISVHIGSKGKSSPHFNYITATGKYEYKRGVEKVGHGNMPHWAEKEPSKFWQAADEFERANGQTYKEHILSIPREMPTYLRRRFIKDWIKQEVGDKHPYTYAIHETQSSDGGTNPHAHVMYCTRELDGIERSPEQFFKRYNAKNPELGGARKAETGLSRGEMKKNLLEQRERWDNLIVDFAREWGFDLEPHHAPTEPTPNKSMAEIQKSQKLDDMLENHPWYISAESVPKFVPPELEPPPEPPRMESLTERLEREEWERRARAMRAIYGDDFGRKTTDSPKTRSQTPQRENTSHDYDLGM